MASGTIRNLPQGRQDGRGLDDYLEAFLAVWNRELEPTGEFRWRIVLPDSVPMLGVIFTTQEKGLINSDPEIDDQDDWNVVLEKCSNALRQEVSRSIYIDGLIRVVTDTDIYLIKRNERRLWTRSMAREDAEATLLQAMYLQQARV